jgi:hypothetical protein
VRQRRAARAAARVPRPPPELRLRRSRLEVALDARLAVRAGVRLEDFLRHRFARYAGRLPIPLEDLPVVIDVEGSDPVVRARAPAKPSLTGAYAPSAAREDEATALLRRLAEREGPNAAAELRDAATAVEALGARVDAARARADALARALADDLAAGKVPAPPAVHATAEQLGRPPVPSPLPAAALRLLVVLFAAAEAWFFSAPILAAQGLSPDALSAPSAAAALSLLFALGLSAAAFAFAAAALARARELVELSEAGRRRRLVAAAAFAAAALAAAVAALAAAPGAAGERALLAAVPFAGALLLRAASALAAGRETAAAAALAWDRALAADLAERARRTGIVEAARAELASLEEEREGARRRLRLLEKRAVEADRLATARARAEARRLEKLAESLAGALEEDRYVFVRLASSAAHDALARPARPRLEPAVEPSRFGMAG